jgi:outer membrane protein assembly factor BamB
MTRLLPLTLVVAIIVWTSVAGAADWPQWMGVNRDGVWTETGILKAFPKGGPKILWRVPVGGGYAGPAVADGKVYVADKVTTSRVGGPKDPFAGSKTPVCVHERILCLSAKTGKEFWKHEYEVMYQISYPAGPRCTPLVHAGLVYTLGAMGDLLCLNADSGKVIWAKNFPKDYGVKAPQWGFAGHPVVHKNLLICLVGGNGSTVVAFDTLTGREVWRALSAPEPGYNSPVLIEAGRTTQLVVWTPKGLYGLNPETGTTHWHTALVPDHAMSIMSPRKDGEYLFVAGLKNIGLTLRLDPDKPEVTEVWRGKGEPNPTTGVYPINMTPFVEGGVVYGADQPGMFRAVELTTGKRLWCTFRPVFGEEKLEDFKGGACGTVFVVKNGDRFFLFAETGDLVIAHLTPKGYEEISRTHLLAPTTEAMNHRKAVWTHPAFADRCVFARNDEELVCASLATE